jgi:hypothetical protein
MKLKKSTHKITHNDFAPRDVSWGWVENVAYFRQY